jgi:hypothetical protein
MNCLFKDGESTEEYKAGEGITKKVGFHPERLKESELVITELLDELPDAFKRASGGGWSFLNLCEDKHGNQWTGMYQIMEELVILGVATNKVSYLISREGWSLFPGGMPYIVIN